MWIKTADLDASTSGPAVFISFSVTTKINKKMDEILSKHDGVSYYKYSDYKLIRNCAFGSRTEALLDSDDDGIYDIHEQGGIALPSGKIIYTNPCDEDTDHDHLLDNKEIYVTYGEIKDGKVPVKCYYVSDPSDPDTDGDRLSDYDESNYGTIMTNPLDRDSDEAKQLKLAIANGANDNITRPMVDKINDIVDSADKIEFKPKATLMDDVAESVTLRLSGKWEKVNEHMSDFSRAYQKQITGREGMAWVQNGVKFDGIKDGILLDAKG